MEAGGTGVVLATSCLLGLSFWPWYVGQGPAGWLWTAHGYLYIVYVVVAFLLALKLDEHSAARKQEFGALASLVVPLLAGHVAAGDRWHYCHFGNHRPRRPRRRR